MSHAMVHHHHCYNPEEPNFSCGEMVSVVTCVAKWCVMKSEEKGEPSPLRKKGKREGTKRDSRSSRHGKQGERLELDDPEGIVGGCSKFLLELSGVSFI